MFIGQEALKGRGPVSAPASTGAVAHFTLKWEGGVVSCKICRCAAGVSDGGGERVSSAQLNSLATIERAVFLKELAFKHTIVRPIE